jgi:LuxR family maltose regulon positive regulatory protein
VPFESAVDLADAKTQAPVGRPGMVIRTKLLELLNKTLGPSLICVAAPAGYGKSTVLAQWAECKRPRAAWLSADRRDNDPVVLVRYLAAALNQVETIPPPIARALAAPDAASTAVRLLQSALRSMSAPMVFVLDHAEAITNRECLDIITELALGMPQGSQFAVASRDLLPLPTARLRSEGGVLEVGASELAMDDAEAALLLREAGLDVASQDVRDLVERTEGWPAGMYLAALAMNAGSPRAEAVLSFTGGDRYIGDYLRSEFLERQSRSDVSFLTRTSILDRMCGPLCDAVLNVPGSDRVLERLDRRNLLVVPLDRRRHWYRYHQLFRELLQAELSRREPELIPTLHLRAATWDEANARPEAAIEHAQAAGDANAVGRLVLKWMQPVWASGRVDTVLQWMEWLEGKTWVEHYPAIAVHGALILALLGRPGETERWAAAAEGADSRAVLPDGDTTQGLVSYLRALLCRRGLAQARRDSQAAWEGLAPASPYRATMLQTEGICYLLEGDQQRAEPILAHAVDVARAAKAAPTVTLLLAEQAIVAIEGSDWTEAVALIDQAVVMVTDGQYQSYWTSALVYAVAARVAAHRGQIVPAGEYATRAARLRPLLTYALPVGSAQALLELARAYLSLGDTSGVQAVLRQAHDIFHQRPDLGLLPRQADELRAKLSTDAAGAGGASSLTTAELRLLPLLPTHLTYAEIGERLYVSRNTIRTQAASTYRKFGVASRGEAVARMHELGLLT